MMNIKLVGIILGSILVLIDLGVMIWLIVEIIRRPKIWWLQLFYSLKYGVYEIYDFIYQKPKAYNSANPQTNCRPKNITNYEFVLAQLNQAINAEIKSNPSRYKVHNSKPRLFSNTNLDKLNHLKNHSKKDCYEYNSPPIHTIHAPTLPQEKEENNENGTLPSCRLKSAFTISYNQV